MAQTAIDTKDIIGFKQFYGLSPCVGFLSNFKEEIEKDERDLNFLVSECADLRHIMKGVSDVLPLKDKRTNKINIYLHEKEFGCLARDLIFLTIMCETSLSKRDRMELFVDIYGNLLISDKTNTYLQSILNELIQLVTEDSRCTSVIKDNVHMDTMRFKDRDELEQSISSYNSVHEFDIEKMWETRLRASIKERYDFRKNMFDWDYNMYVKEIAEYIHPKEYKDWRTTGLGFEWRLTENKIPNRTFGSYIPGYQKKQKQHIAIRGFWGDILQSPFIPYGLELWKEPEASEFFKKINYQLLYSCVDVTKYMVQYYIQKFEDLTEYDFPFTRKKHVVESLTGDKEKEEPKVQEVTEEEAKNLEETKDDPAVEHLKTGAKNIDLSGIEEGNKGESMLEEGNRQWLKGFEQLNIHFHLMSDPDLKQLKTKKRYQCLFDGGILSVQSCANISEDFSTLFKDKAKVYCETADFLIGLLKDQRVMFRKLILEKVTTAGWKVISDKQQNIYKHHFLLEVNNPQYHKMLMANENSMEEEDFMDLSGL